jgi:hypothetical protein
MTGLKFKLAHRRADKDKWNISDKAQRKRLINFLKDIIVQLEKAPENLNQAPDTKAVPPPKKAPAKRTAVKTRKQATVRKKKAIEA